MIKKILSSFRIFDESESPDVVIDRISKDSVFKGTNLWILVFAIFIASLGLNINSTAVIIGAMLISPLMGPIMGMGLGIAINDLDLLKKAARNYSFAIMVGLITSTLYFSITPLDEAYSELLSRTTPNIYDVFIALFGGFAGIIATSSKNKGNVIPGVAIATALMPPLCTAGYGLATFDMKFLFGALYLFTINTVFIALSTFITVRMLKYPIKHLFDKKADTKSHRIITAIVVLTVIPSIYFSYVIIQQNRFARNANIFVETHSSFEGNYLLNKSIDPQKKQITLTFGGKGLADNYVHQMKEQLQYYSLGEANLIVKQGFTSIFDEKESGRIRLLSQLVDTKNNELLKYKTIVDSIYLKDKLLKQVAKELEIQYPEIIEAYLYPTSIIPDSLAKKAVYALIKTKRTFSYDKQKKMEEWLRIRLSMLYINLIFRK